MLLVGADDPHNDHGVRAGVAVVLDREHRIAHGARRRRRVHGVDQLGDGAAGSADDGAPGQRGAQRADGMGGPGRGEQQRLGAGVHGGVPGVQQQLPQRLAQVRAAGLAREHHLVARGAQGLGQGAGLGGLAGSVRSLDGDEQAAMLGLGAHASSLDAAPDGEGTRPGRPPRLTGMSAPMHFALLVDHWLFRVLAIAALVLEVWALVDVVRRRPDDFARIGGRDRSFWLILTGVAAVVGLLGVLAGGGMGMFGLVAACVACVYLAGPRQDMGPALRR